MILHVWIAGQEKFNADVEPGHVQEALEFINRRMDDLGAGGRVTVALDSATHENVVYLLNRRATEPFTSTAKKR